MNEAIPNTDNWTICDLLMWKLDEWPDVIRCQHHESDEDLRFYYPERTCNRVLYSGSALKNDYYGCSFCCAPLHETYRYCQNCGEKVVDE